MRILRTRSSEKGQAMIIARPRFRLFLLALVAVLSLVWVTGAAAAPPTAASGTFTTTSAVFNSTRSADGNTIIDITATLSYTGTFNGTSILQGKLIFHSDGSANFFSTETFTGTVNGVPGTVTFQVRGGGGSAGDYHGIQTIVSATGDLAGLHGVLTQTGTVQANGPAGTYTGQ